MKTYFIELYNGHCTLLKAKDLDEATNVCWHYNGKSNTKLVRPATQDDIDWIRAMGGWVP